MWRPCQLHPSVQGGSLQSPCFLAKPKHHLVAVAQQGLSYPFPMCNASVPLFSLKMLMQQPIPLVFNNAQRQSPRRAPPPSRQPSTKKAPQPGPMAKRYGGPPVSTPRPFLREPCSTPSQVPGCAHMRAGGTERFIVVRGEFVSG